MNPITIVFDSQGDVSYATLKSPEEVAKSMGCTIRWGRDNIGGSFMKDDSWTPRRSFIISDLREKP